MVEVVHRYGHIQSRIAALPCYIEMVRLNLLNKVFIDSGRICRYWPVHQCILGMEDLGFRCSVTDAAEEILVINFNCLLEVLVPSSVGLCVV
jgi:hypothetical protein